MFPQLDDTKTVFDELCDARKENAELREAAGAAIEIIYNGELDLDGKIIYTAEQFHKILQNLEQSKAV